MARLRGYPLHYRITAQRWIRNIFLAILSEKAMKNFALQQNNGICGTVNCVADFCYSGYPLCAFVLIKEQIWEYYLL